MTEGNHSRSGLASLPPWLWFWLVVFVVSLPWVAHGIWRLHQNTLSSLETLPAGTVTGLHVYFLSVLPQLLSTLALVFGLLTVALPWLRAAYLERRFRLKEMGSTLPVLEEVRQFVQEYAPGIEVRTNPIRMDQLVFVYPLGFRRTALAVFGGMVRLWRSDRQMAQAVLLHEIGHHRQGDTFIVGAGSFFGTLARYWLILCSLSVAAAVLDGAITSWSVADRLGNDLFAMVATFVIWVVPETFLEFTGILMWLVGALVIPLIGGIWCAELNADRFAIGAQGTPKHLMGALDKLAPRSSWWRWILFRMSHPPQGLRRWASRRSGRTSVLIALLLIFPLAYVAKAASMTGWGLSLYLSQCVLGCDMAAVWKELGTNVGYLLDGYVRVWFAMAVLFLIWPVVGGYWERVFSGLSGSKLASRSHGYRAYVLSAALACVLAISCYVLLLSS